MARNAPALAEGLRLSFERCLAAYETCRQARLHHRLKSGRAVSPALLRVLDECAEHCRGCFDLLFGASRMHATPCPVCVEIGRACARSCGEAAQACRAQPGDDAILDVCAQVCDSCARSCLRLH